MPAGANSSLPIGVYRTAAPDLGAVQAYESFLNPVGSGQVDYVLAYMADKPTWAQFEAATLQSGTNQPAGAHTAAEWGPLLGNRTLMLGVPACVQGTTWAQEAAGVNDAHWTALATTLVTAGLGNAVLRLARELNTGYAWKVTPATANDHAAGWRRIVAVMKAVPGFACKFCWNPMIGQGNFGPGAGVESCYPDQGTIDVIGLDCYDWGYTTANETIRTLAEQQAFFASQLAMWDGLNGWRNFAAGRNLSLCFPEWGLKLWGAAASYNGGGDDPYFIAHMASFMQSMGSGDPLAMHAFWEDAGMGVADPDDHARRLVAVPQARAAFLSSFGGRGQVLESLTPR